ncbi:SDR family oxidoreductase [Spongiibacter sp. KMU-158]|uniref:SDR family oxidoreductase n=1 Tax=Spongiibacter pelagi TaxID=2760804 RepID=A0A927BZ51_9GAMM|nr:SDR family oxidoreductase [Spongiibacter pelagi]MBD2857709.1 SDR family oxidoreductase [Spongiibacter pelagi]
MTRKNILITGASSGLGEGMAWRFAAKGCNLALCARRLDALEKLKVDIERAHPQVKVAIKSLDVCDYDQISPAFHDLKEQLGGLDRVIVNAGMGKGASLGTGYFHANRKTAETNYVAAIAQCEAALEIFRAQNHGHLVTISSMSAVRGMPGSFSVYASSKAALRNLSEGIAADLYGTPIKVSCILPGFILTPINADMKRAPLRVSLEKGCNSLVKAIEREPKEACIPGWPWVVVNMVMKIVPLKVLSKMSG